jgi:NitT/TauT family transport system permease protein
MAHLASNRERRAQELAAPGIAGPQSLRARAQRFSPLRLWLPLLLGLLLLLAWEGAVSARLLNPVLFAPPSIIAQTIVASLADGSLALNLRVTLLRVFAGLLLGGGAGVVMGLLMGWSRGARETADPWIAAVHAVPKIAILPLLIFFLGIGEEPKIALAALVAFFPMLINTMAGVGQINPVHFQVAQNYGARLPQLFTRVILPGSLPLILSGLRIAFNATLLVIIAAEMVNGSSGLGRVIWESWETLQVENLWSSLVLSAMIGIVFNLLLLRLTRRLVPWQAQNQY